MKNIRLSLLLKRWLTFSLEIINLGLIVFLIIHKFSLEKRVFLLIFFLTTFLILLILLFIFFSLKIKYFKYEDKTFLIYAGFKHYRMYLNNNLIKDKLADFKARSVILETVIDDLFILCHIKSNKIYLRVNYELIKPIKFQDLKKKRA